jgi:hypothetical protein
MNWDEAFSRLTQVRNELEAARLALARAQRAIADGEAFPGSGSAVKPSHVDQCARHVELTYLLRLFAEFEGILRDYWAVARPAARRRRTNMEILLNRVAILCTVPYDTLQGAHQVREYRNLLTHHHREALPISFLECKSRLGTFLSFLPTRW